MDAKGEQTGFVYTTYIQETPERVWQGLTDPALMKRYWRHQKAGPKTFRSDWKKGSTYEMAHDEVGLVVSGPEQVILESDPPHRLAYTWHTITPEWATAVGMDEATAATWRAEARSKVAFDIEDVGHGTQAHGHTTGSRPVAPCAGDLRGVARCPGQPEDCQRRGRPCALRERPPLHPGWRRASRARGAGCDTSSGNTVAAGFAHSIGIPRWALHTVSSRTS